jgi:hypothetical protein
MNQHLPEKSKSEKTKTGLKFDLWGNPQVEEPQWTVRQGGDDHGAWPIIRRRTRSCDGLDFAVDGFNASVVSSGDCRCGKCAGFEVHCRSGAQYSPDA